MLKVLRIVQKSIITENMKFWKVTTTVSIQIWVSVDSYESFEMCPGYSIPMHAQFDLQENKEKS